MSIQVLEIQKRVLAALDDEYSDRYKFNQDIKPNLNGAVEILVSWLNEAFGQKKIAPEVLRDLTYVKVWQADLYSRVAFNKAQVGHSLWTLFAVYPKPKTSKNVFGKGSKEDKESIFREDLSFVSSVHSARRLTFEEWNDNEDNVFMAGNSNLKGGLAEYGYLDFANYSSTSYNTGADQVKITIRPAIANELVAMAYLKYPTPVSTVNDTIEFPESLTELITEITLNGISKKQSDGTNLYGVTSQNINRLVSLFR